MATPTNGDEENQQLLPRDGRKDNETTGPGLKHVENEPDRRFFSWCILCFGAREKLDFTQPELDALWHLRFRLVNKPRPEESELQAQCLELWNTAFPSEQRKVFETGEHWKQMGFQGRDPATDVRTGAWPLQQLASFARHYPVKFREMVVSAGSGGPSDYLFAISCFNASHMLAMFFDLVIFASASPIPDAPVATKRQLKFLTEVIVKECGANNVDVSAEICRRVMDELFVEVMVKVHATWLDMAKTTPGVTLMDFQRALRVGFDANAAFWQHPCRDLNDMKLV